MNRDRMILRTYLRNMRDNMQRSMPMARMRDRHLQRSMTMRAAGTNAWMHLHPFRDNMQRKRDGKHRNQANKL